MEISSIQVNKCWLKDDDCSLSNDSPTTDTPPPNKKADNNEILDDDSNNKSDNSNDSDSSSLKSCENVVYCQPTRSLLEHVIGCEGDTKQPSTTDTTVTVTALTTNGDGEVISIDQGGGADSCASNSPQPPELNPVLEYEDSSNQESASHCYYSVNNNSYIYDSDSDSLPSLIDDDGTNEALDDVFYKKVRRE
jgi:hypothetical protein